ncbi:MAG TPA: YdcF family protein [Gemmataceae bacterium]|nr:YdcF family protein [Gemmataceae bacterium]
MYHYVVELLQPFVLLYLLIGLALLKLWWRRREQWRLLLVLTIAFCALFLCSTPLASYLALGSLEWSYPPREHRPDDAQGIVILAGYVRPAEGVRRHAELGQDTLYRCLEGAELYHLRKPCPVLVSGGRVDDSQPLCAPLMQDFLVKLGVPPTDILVEDRSRTTWENAVESRKLLAQRSIGKILLVTDAAHLVRAERCFRKQGIEVVSWGCRYRATTFSLELKTFLPSPSGGAGLLAAVHEWLGLAWYRLRGRI